METNKKILRRTMRELRNQLSDEDVLKKSQKIFEQIVKSSIYQNSQYIFSYMSFRNEVDTAWFHHKVLEDGKVLLLPKVLTKERMEFYKIKNLSYLNKSAMGILEPNDLCELYQTEKNYIKDALMILPGLAFDLYGGRLGYGGGYYDRYIEKLNGEIILCGAAFECQCMEHVPCQMHDVRMNIIVTEDKWIERVDVE